MTENPAKKQKIGHQIDYNSLLRNNYFAQKHCDVHFSCKSTNNDEWKKIGAHKLILVSVSDVFETMFHGEIPEQNDKEIKIYDISFETFRMFLGFIYGCQLTFKTSNEIAQFLYAAHKYICPNALTFGTDIALQNLIPQSSILFYETAVLHDINDLKEASWKKIKENISAVISCTEFLSAKPESVNLIYDIENPSIHSELDLVWALERYITYNKSSDPEIFTKVRPALRNINFLSFTATDIERTFLLSYDEKKVLLECLPENSDLSKVPESLSTSRCNRSSLTSVLTRKISINNTLYLIHQEHKCKYGGCSYLNHETWNCKRLNEEIRVVLKSIFNKYKHTNMMLYHLEDLEILMETYKKADIL